MKISYYSTIKGRAWQFKQVANHNLDQLRMNPDAEWVILDFNDPESTLKDFIRFGYAKDLIATGRVKLYRLNRDFYWDIPLAKNVAAMLSTGDVLFNLDIDNRIGNSAQQLRELKDDQILTTIYNHFNGTRGRIGITRKQFIELGGNDLAMVGAGAHDVDLISRAIQNGCTEIMEESIPYAVINDKTETARYLGEDYVLINKRSLQLKRNNYLNKVIQVNPNGCTLQNGIDLLDYAELIE